MSAGASDEPAAGSSAGPAAGLVLRDYWRSSASYRVRIGAALKGLPLTTVAVDLRTGAHLSGDLGEVNPQRLLPVLETEEGALTQSLAILEYLDDLHPQRPLLDHDPLTRARQRAMAQIIACDVHPVCNLRVLKALRAQGCDEAAVRAWMHQWMHAGFEALEAYATALGIDRPTPTRLTPTGPRPAISAAPSPCSPTWCSYPRCTTPAVSSWTWRPTRAWWP